MKNKIEILFIFFVLVIFTIVFAKYYYPELYSYTVRGSENSIRMNLDYLKYKVTLFKDTKINLADANNNDYAKLFDAKGYKVLLILHTRMIYSLIILLNRWYLLKKLVILL